MRNNRDHNVRIASCPGCGGILFRGMLSDVEIKCAKCNKELMVELRSDHVFITIKGMETAASSM